MSMKAMPLKPPSSSREPTRPETGHAVLYLRSSKDRNDVSIDAQRRALHETAGQRRLVVVDEFVDAVESGKDDDRPGFQRLLHGLKQAGRDWNHVLVLDTSRVARRRLIAQLFERDCEKQGVKISYKNVPETDPATEMLLKSVLQAMDEWHSINSKTKGLAGMSENVRQGWRAGGRAPRGYRLVYHPTGAIRDGAPVTKSKLVPDEDLCDQVQAYLQLRAIGTPRGVATSQLRLPWPTSSTHSMDWQAMTYAGHTVWNMHNERNGGAAADGEKRRPRSEWVVHRDTHPALITDDEAETILRQQELAIQGRRLRASPLLFTGLAKTSDGRAWHSDGCGHYRVGKGRKIAASRLEPALLEQIHRDLTSDEAVELMMSEIKRLTVAPPVDRRQVAGLERRVAGLGLQISRTIDLAAKLPEPAPVLRRVQDLENQRNALLTQITGLQSRRAQVQLAVEITADQVRALLTGVMTSITEGMQEDIDEARAALAEVIERIELQEDETPVRLHYAVRATGDNVASPRGFEPL